MTDTTDIAALKKQIDTAADIIRDLTDKLEAERQRADVAVTERNTAAKQASAARNGFDEQYQLREKAEASVGVLEGVIARKEFDALKGEQVPVAWLNDAHLARGHIEGEAGEEDAGPGMIPVYRERFIAPQKPVVLHDERDHYQDTDEYEQGYVRGWNASRMEAKAAIEAAGGIVKDGE